jgi:peptidyl-tRNA hydrolase, PTH2 family
MYKQVIIVRQDLKMPKGKLATQVAHASVDAVMNSDKEMIEAWKNEGQKKAVLKVMDKRELIQFKKKADKEGLITGLVKDAGKTFFKIPTITCLAIGPAEEKKIDEVTKELGLL